MNYGFFSWIILGLLAGFLAKAIMPGTQGGGFVMTGILGMVGALVGGYLSTFFGFSEANSFWGSIVVATIGSIIVLFVYGLIVGKR